MPSAINESPVQASNLTPEQRRLEEARILGLEPPQTDSNEPTLAQIEFMRTQIARYDSLHVPREFDLNRPPKKPYHFEEYPKMLYHHGDRVSKVVRNQAQENGLVELGYVREPFAAEAAPPPIQFDPATIAEIQRIDNELKKRKPAK